MTGTVQAGMRRSGPAYYFIQDSHSAASSLWAAASNLRDRKLEVTKMFQVNGRRKIPYARALYLSAIAAVLSACTQTSPVPAESVQPDAAALNADVPEVVITASRVEPGFNG
jgi:hypothetical protein